MINIFFLLLFHLANIPQESANLISLESALKERLEVYRRSKSVAENEGNASKARRYTRICKQFEDALKLHSRGKPVPIDELPTPPGFSPLTAPTKPKADPPQISEPAEEASKPKPSPSSSPNPSVSKELTPSTYPGKIKVAI